MKSSLKTIATLLLLGSVLNSGVYGSSAATITLSGEPCVLDGDFATRLASGKLLLVSLAGQHGNNQPVNDFVLRAITRGTISISHITAALTTTEKAPKPTLNKWLGMAKAKESIDPTILGLRSSIAELESRISAMQEQLIAGEKRYAALSTSMTLKEGVLASTQEQLESSSKSALNFKELLDRSQANTAELEERLRKQDGVFATQVLESQRTRAALEVQIAAKGAELEAMHAAGLRHCEGLQQQIAGLQKELDLKATVVASAVDALKVNAQKIKELEESIALGERNLFAAKQEIDAARRAFAETEDETKEKLRISTQNLVFAVENFDRSKRAEEELQSKLDGVLANEASLTEQLAAAGKTLAVEKQKALVAQQDLAALEETKARLASETKARDEAASAAFADLQGRLDESERAKSAVLAEKDKEAAAALELRQQISTLDVQMVDVRAQLVAATSRADSQAAELGKSAEEVLRLQALLKVTQSERSAAGSAKDEELARVNAELAKSESASKEAAAAIAAMQAKLSKAEPEVARLLAESDAAQAKQAAATSALEARLREAESKGAEIVASVRAETAAKVKEISSLRLQLADATRTAKPVTASVLSGRLGATEDHERVKAELAVTMQRATESEATAATLRGLVGEKDGEIARLTARVEELKKAAPAPAKGWLFG